MTFLEDCAALLEAIVVYGIYELLRVIRCIHVEEADLKGEIVLLETEVMKFRRAIRVAIGLSLVVLLGGRSVAIHTGLRKNPSRIESVGELTLDSVDSHVCVSTE